MSQYLKNVVTCKCKNRHNTCKFWSNFDKVFCKNQFLKSVSKQWFTTNFKIHQNCFKTNKYCDNTCKYCTCRWTHFSSIGSILVSITSILTRIVTILASIEQVNTPLNSWGLIQYLYKGIFPLLSFCNYFMNYSTWFNLM